MSQNAKLFKIIESLHVVGIGKTKTQSKSKLILIIFERITELKNIGLG